MKKYKTVKETVERKVLEQEICDFCGLDLKFQDKKENIIETYDWEGVGYGPEADCTVELRLSSSYPECGESRTFKLDVCSKCFKVEILDRTKTHDIEDTDW